LNILHVIRGLANSSGTTHIVGPLAEAQARQGHSVKVLFVDKPGCPPIVPDPSLVESQGFPMTVPTEHVGWSWPFARALPSAVRDADVVHIHAIWNFPTWWAMREARRAGVPYFVAPQGSLEDWALGRSRRLKALYASVAEKPYFDRAAAMQALTATEAAQCRKFGIKAPVTILPNGVDLATVDRQLQRPDLRMELSLPADSVLFLFIGRLFPKKGLDLLIPAFGKLAATRADVFLIVAGHDSGSGYRAEVAQLALTHGVAPRTRFLGEVCGDRKFAILRGADVFVLSSHSEGLPVAVLEAMACRCPVVITRNCNVPEVKDRDAGWLVEANIDSVFSGLSEASASPVECRRRGENARSLVEANFTWDRIALESIRFYRSHQSRTN
jgi:glycosyltransferase involved in cell wall biosynthesis